MVRHKTCFVFTQHSEEYISAKLHFGVSEWMIHTYAIDLWVDEKMK